MGFKSVQISTQRLRDLVRASDKSLVMIAKEAGIKNPGTISNWMSEPVRVGISAERFPELAKALGVPQESLKAHAKIAKISVTRETHDALSRMAARERKTIEQLLREFVGGSIDENYEELKPATKPGAPPSSETHGHGNAVKSATGR